MEKASTKSALKFVKNTSQSAAQWSTTNSRGMTKDVLKDKFYDKTKASRRSPPKESNMASRRSPPKESNMTPPRSPPKENTKPQEFKLHTQERAVKRAMFNYAVTTKFYIMELQKKQEERLQKLIEEEEVRLLRKEMIPRAQLMPYFDKPFSPQRSSRSVPRESCLHMMSSKCWSCSVGNEIYNLHHYGHQALKPIK
ncbi:protein TPX2 isoform X1 [Cajanus cajan]|uniref:protein TPX2 isoform X1 n=1 Tax=Cajanus cajan TaxID=3821 RepID=UPI00098D915E|nr:protein TPX2 isoform X1 [Cajanus cajan]